MLSLRIIALTLIALTLTFDLCLGASISNTTEAPDITEVTDVTEALDITEAAVSTEAAGITETPIVGNKPIIADDSCYKADIVFVLDSSGSIKLNNWFKVLNFTKEIISAFRIGPDNINVGLNYYGNEATLAFDLNTYNSTEAVLGAIDEIPWKDQETNTSGGLRLMHTEMFQPSKGARIDAPDIAIVITDGESNRDQDLTIPEANIARNKGIVLFAIGIGEDVSQDELIGIGNPPPENFVFNADNFDVLNTIRETVVVAACQVASECTENGDWVAILDSSGSVGYDNFMLTKDFVRRLVGESNIDNGLSRIGLITFSTEAHLEFNLNNYTTREDVQAAIDEIPFRPGKTNTAAALRMAREELFTPETGDREEFRNIIILFTDGGSGDFQETLREARLARISGITILVVAVTDWVNMREIKEVATDPDDSNVFLVRRFDEFGSIQNLLKRAICDDDNECSSNPCQNGGTCVNKVNSYLCRCPDGFAGVNCQIACNVPSDITILLDSTIGSDDENYYKLQDFVKKVAISLNIDSGLSRLALQMYSTNTSMNIDLADFVDKQSLVDGISFPLLRGKSDTANALQGLVKSFEGRNTTRKIGIVVSDGRSSDAEATFEAAVQAHQAGITILGVGIKVEGDLAKMEMTGLTSDPDAMNYIEAGNFDAVGELSDLLVQNVCNDIDECASNPCQGGGICVDKFNMYECICPIGRSGVNCERSCDGTADVLFLIDSSGSIRENRFHKLLNFVTNVVDKMEVRDDRVRVGVVTFADDAIVRFPLNKYHMKEDIKHKINMLPYSRGKTNTAAALEKLQEIIETSDNGARDFTPKLAFVLTDGVSTMREEETIPKAILAKIAGATIIVVSIENDVDNLEILGMASPPARDNIVNVQRYDDLDTVIANFTNVFCDEVDHCAENNTCQNGGTCVNAPHRFVCVCPDPFVGPTCGRSCTSSFDITLVLDASGSYNFEMAQEFARFLMHGLNFNNGRTRVAVVTYQDKAEIRFGLDEYSMQMELLTAMAFNNKPWVAGTNTADAIAMVRDEVFSVARGDRVGVDNIAIIVTDGNSNINTANIVPEANDAKLAGIRIITVGVGSDVNMAELNSMASEPESENVFVAPSGEMLSSQAEALLNILCN